ncbi:MAG: phosphotransferase [Chloroflexi bacterium]|nr:phosphotransferase [Chloroflexota bacterium]
MKSFESLSRRGQASRLRTLAINVLAQYAFDAADVRLIGVYTNVLFCARAVDGSTYVIRVCKPGWRTETDLRSEVAWLRALNRDTDIGVPQLQPARNGDFVVEARAGGVPEPRRCVVMSWIPGTSRGKRLAEANLFKMGVLFARLHEHASSFSPPAGFTQRTMCNLYARGEQDVLFGDDCRTAFTPRNRDVFEQVRARVDAAYRQRYADPAGLRVIHYDLWHGNIKIHRGHLHPLDFEDTVWGYPVQDLAMALQDLMLEVKPDEYEPFQRAVRAGYESRGAWPETYDGQIDTFRAGRMLWTSNYVARFEHEHLRGFVEKVTPLFERFLETGRLRKS